MGPRWGWCVLMGGMLMGVVNSEGQQSAASPSIGQQAVHAVLKHYVLNPLVKVPRTGKPLARDGAWKVDKTPPPVCGQTQGACVTVIYDVPGAGVRCAWAVALSADGSDGNFLEENEDAERYLIRAATPTEAAALVKSRFKPVYPPIAEAADVSGEVDVLASIGISGKVENVVVTKGPQMLKGAILDAAPQWTFLPLQVGKKAIPYQVQMTFTFHSLGPPTGTVAMQP